MPKDKAIIALSFFMKKFKYINLDYFNLAIQASTGLLNL